jgi:hypothetical protein
MRLKHPDMRPAGPPVSLRFDGREIEALPGETIAAALAASDLVAVRQARSGAPGGPFCGMGVCFDCLVTVDGQPNQRACLTKVEAGMEVHSAPNATPHPPGPAAPAEETACDVLVVGAGPAGLSAARSLALAGAGVIVADERLHAGGQYFKPLAGSHQADPSTLDRQFRDGAILRQSALLAGVRILSEATVWAAFSAHEVAAIVAGRRRCFGPTSGAGDRRLRAVGYPCRADAARRDDGGLTVTLARPIAWRRAGASWSGNVRSACKPPWRLDGGARRGRAQSGQAVGPANGAIWRRRH